MNSGWSLAMNSANSETKNRTMNSHNDQKPRLLALKLRQRRALSGDSVSQCSSTGTPMPSGPTGAVSGACGLTRASTSHLPRLEIDPRIDPGIGQVGDQVHDQADQGEDVEIGEHHRVVAVEHAFEAEQPQTVQREDRLDQQGAGEECGDEGAGKAGDDEQHGVAKDVAI